MSKQTMIKALALGGGGLALLLTVALGSATAFAQAAPVISGIGATASDTSATVTWQTDIPADSQIAYGTTTPYSIFSAYDPTMVTSHSLTLLSLLPETLYHFAVLSGIASSTNGMATTSTMQSTSSDMTFTTTNTASTTASTTPVISSIMTTPTDTGATITWTTDQPSSSQVSFGTTTAYGSTTTLDNTQVTSHTAALSGLIPNTMYHFAVSSGIGTNAATSSLDQTFTTLQNIASTTPVISAVIATPTDTSVTITWATDQPSSSQVLWGPTATYGNSSTLDSTQVTSHSVAIGGLTPSTLYHFQVLSGIGANAATSSLDQTFTTMVSSSTSSSTPTTADIQALQQEISALQSQIDQLWATIAGLNGNNGNGGNDGNGTTTSPTSSATIDQNGTTVSGGSIDFGGHGFMHEEQVTVTLNGSKVATAHADGGGNFSTGSVNLPTTPGTYTYTFAGADGDSANATITVQ